MEPAAHRMHSLHPRSWPIAAKLAIVLVAAALLPMLIVSYYNLQQGLAATAKSESDELEQLAADTGRRIDQLIKETRNTISYLSWGEDVIRLATAPGDKSRLAVEDKMSRLLAAHEDIELLMVLDHEGKVLASSKPAYVGRQLQFRDYFKEAARGKEYVSDLEVGTASNSAGLYFSAPVRGSGGRISGVTVLKLRGAAITAIMEEARSSQAELASSLVDGDGIIIYHTNPTALYHSLRPLPAERQKKLLDEKRFGIGVEKIPSYDLKQLGEQLANARQPGHAMYFSPISGVSEIAGFSPLTQVDWRVIVSESEQVYLQPLQHLFRNAVNSVVIAGAIFIVVAILLARTFTHPLRALTNSAAAIESGDLEHAKVFLARRDELGRFAETFNAMIDGIKARQRERDIFGRMVSPEVREKLLKGELKLGGENLRVSVLFSDIRGFSTMSEKMSPHDVVMLLNEYLTEMTEAVRPWGGYVNNFIGDAIVVIFGAPEAHADNEWSAICAAQAMKVRLEDLNRRRAELGDPPLRTGIGISTGKVVAGQIGSIERFMYTVIGDAVNIAARLEELTKQFDGNPILLNAATYEGCRKRSTELEIIDQGLQRVKGREEPVHVYAVYTEAPKADVTQTGT